MNELDRLERQNDTVINKMARFIGLALPIFAYLVFWDIWVALVVALAFGIGWISGAKRFPFGPSFDEDMAQGQRVLGKLTETQKETLLAMFATHSKPELVKELQSMSGEKMRASLYAVDVLAVSQTNAAQKRDDQNL